jgi:hypothetical protein
MRYRTIRGKRGCLDVSVESSPGGEARYSPFFLFFFFFFFFFSLLCAKLRAVTHEREARRSDRNIGRVRRRLTIISGSFQLERNLESKFLFGNSFNIDMPNSTWVGNYRFEVYCIDKGLF